MKRILVTGAAGFIGRHLLNKLCLDWSLYDPQCLDQVTSIDPRFSFSNLPTFASHVYFTSFEEWAENHGDCTPFDVVIHLAVHSLDIESRLKPSIAASQDLLLDYAMCKYIEEHPPKLFIAMSSMAIDAADTDPYAHVKRTLEFHCRRLAQQGIPTVVFRPAAGYGADQDETFPFRAILGRAMRQEDPLTVWGSGLQVRDWIHIDDIVRALLWAIQTEPKTDATPIPLGTGRAVNFIELAHMMAKQVGYNPEILPLTDKAESGLSRVVDPQEAWKLGFSTKITLEEGIRRAIEELG